MIDNNSTVYSKNIGINTKVWQYAVILKNAKIGNNCNIGSHCFIENDVFIGNNVTIKNNVMIYDGVTIEDNCFIGPGVVFTNDKYPVSRRGKEKDFNLTKTKICNNVSIGANSTILSNLEIGQYCIIGASSVITKDIPSYSKIYGVEAKIMGKI